jgi:hypothetical protein
VNIVSKVRISDASICEKNNNQIKIRKIPFIQAHGFIVKSAAIMHEVNYNSHISVSIYMFILTCKYILRKIKSDQYENF